MYIDSPIGADPFWIEDTPENLAAFAAYIAANTPPPPLPPSLASLLQQQYGIDLSSLDGGLADTIRAKLTVTDGKLNVSGLYYSGLGDDLISKITQSRDDLQRWIPQGGEWKDDPASTGDNGLMYLAPTSSLVLNSGGGGILRYESPPETALSSLNGLLNLAQHAPSAPSFLTAQEAMVFDRLISGTGDNNWVRLSQETLTGVLHALRANGDGSLDMSAIYGGGLGYDPGPPVDKFAVPFDLYAEQNNGRPTGKYFEWVNFGTKDSRLVAFTTPDPSVGTIVMQTRGPTNSPYQVPVFMPSDAKIAQHNADLANYNNTFGRLRTPEGTMVQVRPNGLTMNIGNEGGYQSAKYISWHPAFGLYTPQENIKPEDEGGFMGFMSKLVETVAPMVVGAVFAMVGGPVGSFVYTYAMTDGDLDKAFLSAALTFVSSGMGSGMDSAATGALTEGAATGALSSQVSGLASMLDITNPIAAAAVNNAAASALRSAASGDNLESVLSAGLTGAATGAFSSFVTAGVSTDVSRSVATAIGDGVAGLTVAALNGDSLDQAAMNGLLGVAAASAGQAVVGAGFQDSAPKVQAAVAAGTSALFNGLVASTINDVPLGVAVGNAIGSGLNAAMRTPELAGPQITPVPAPGEIVVRPLEPLPTGEIAFVGPPSPEAPADVTPAPSVSTPPATDATAWDWYDSSATISIVTDTGPHDEPAVIEKPADAESTYPTGGSAPFPYTVPGSDYKVPTYVVARPGDNITVLVGDNRAAIGDFAIRNGLRNSTIIAGKEYDTTPMDLASLTPEQIKLREQIGDAFIRQDNVRLATLAEQARQNQIAAQLQAARSRDAIFDAGSTSLGFESSPWNGAGSLSGPRPVAIDVNAWTSGSKGKPLLDSPAGYDVNAWRDGSTNSAYLPSASEWLKAQPPVVPLTKQERARQEIDNAVQKLEDGASATLQWIKDNPVTFGALQMAGGVAEIGASFILASGGTVATVTGVGAPVGIPMQVLGWAGVANGFDNVATGYWTMVDRAYQPTYTQQLAGATANALGASPETVQTVENVVGFGQAVFGAHVSGEVAALTTPLRQPVAITPQISPEIDASARFTPKLTEVAAASRQAIDDAGNSAAAARYKADMATFAEQTRPGVVRDLPRSISDGMDQMSPFTREFVSNIGDQVNNKFITRGVEYVPTGFDAAGNPNRFNTITQYLDREGNVIGSISELDNRVLETTRGSTRNQTTIGTLTEYELQSLGIKDTGTGGHGAPRVAVGQNVDKINIFGEPLLIKNQVNVIDDFATKLFDPVLRKDLDLILTKELGVTLPGGDISATLIVSTDRSNYGLRITPTVITRDLYIYENLITGAGSATTRQPLMKVSVTTENLVETPAGGVGIGSVRNTVFTDLSTLPAEAIPESVTVNTRSLFSAMQNSEGIDAIKLGWQTSDIDNTAQFLRSRYSSGAQIGALKKDLDLMPTTDDITRLADFMGQPVTRSFEKYAQDMRVQNIAMIRFDAANAELTKLSASAAPNVEAIQATRTQMDRAKTIMDYYIANPPTP